MSSLSFYVFWNNLPCGGVTDVVYANAVPPHKAVWMACDAYRLATLAIVSVPAFSVLFTYHRTRGKNSKKCRTLFFCWCCTTRMQISRNV